jgi:hypothetical protein
MQAHQVEACIVTLIDAENRRDDAAASAIVSDDFTWITRSTGAEQNRAEMLAAIKAGPTDIIRSVRLDPSGSDLRQVGTDCCIARPIVETARTASPATVEGRFRNILVFKRHPAPASGGAESWKLIAWQVTRLPAPG